MMMRHSRLSIVTGLALLALAIGGQSIQAQQVSAALASKAPEASSIATTAQTNGHVRVIVLLNAPNIANQARPDAATIAAARAQVAGLQDTVLANHFGDATNLRPGRGFTRRHARFAITPGFVIDVDAAELEALASDPLVKTINIDHARPPTLLQSLPLIGQPTAYSNGATGAGWAVAVLDTGVQSNHEFLSGKMVAEACFSNAGGFGGGVSLCPNGQNSQTGTGAANSTTANCINGTTNLCQHGTHVSGIAAGLNTSQSTGEPTNGVARDGKIFAIQIFTRYNDTSNCGPTTPPCVLSWDSDQVSALDYVYQHLTPVAGVNVASVNMSLGGGPNTSTACDSDIQKTPIDNLRAAGVLTAIAAGNDGSKSQISHPACISSAVAVGSTTKSDVVSSFSNMATIVALLAPGGFGGGSCTFGGNNPGYPIVVPRHDQRNDKSLCLRSRHLHGHAARRRRDRGGSTPVPPQPRAQFSALFRAAALRSPIRVQAAGHDHQAAHPARCRAHGAQLWRQCRLIGHIADDRHQFKRPTRRAVLAVVIQLHGFDHKRDQGLFDFRRSKLADGLFDVGHGQHLWHDGHLQHQFGRERAVPGDLQRDDYLHRYDEQYDHADDFRHADRQRVARQLAGYAGNQYGQRRQPGRTVLAVVVSIPAQYR